MIFLFFALAYSVLLLYQGCKHNIDETANNDYREVNFECPAQTVPYPSYHNNYGPPQWWCRENKINEKDYPIFQLSQDYPDSYDEYIKSVCAEKNCPWKKFSFKRNQIDYLKEVIKYAFEGNLEVDWVVQKNSKGRKWFHAPYMHLDIVSPRTQPADRSKPEVIEEKIAREFIHGLTMERPGCLSELNYKVGNKSCAFPPTDPNESFQSWAISFYNERGASYIKKVWDEVTKSTSHDPQNFPKNGFPDGTVAIKLLFTQATPEKIQYLEGSVEWEADTADFIKDGGFEKTKRVKEEKLSKEDCEKDREKCFTKLRLLQIDVAVRDDRQDKEKSPTGWVFATFTYDKDAKSFIEYKSEEEDQKNAWLRITPLGLMFGNDPKAGIGSKIKESLLNTGLKIPQHYGCGDPQNPLKRRLNGPVDNPASSCISCHAQAETPKDLNISKVPYGEMKCKGNSDIAEWFRNINPRSSQPNIQTFTAPTQNKSMFSLDYSLQLREGIRRYCIDIYNNGNNICRLPVFLEGDNYNVITKEGTKTFTVR